MPPLQNQYGGDPCLCGSDLRFRDCHGYFSRRIQVTPEGEGRLIWPASITTRQGRMIVDNLQQQFRWAFNAQFTDDALVLKVSESWPSLLNCSVVGPDATSDLLSSIAHETDQVTERLGRGDSAAQLFQPAYDLMSTTSMTTDNPSGWARFATTCNTWSSISSPGRTELSWQEMVRWFYSHVPTGGIQAVKVDTRRLALRNLINILQRLSLASTEDIRHGIDSISAGRGPLSPSLGFAVPMNFHIDHVWGWSFSHLTYAFAFFLPEAQCTLQLDQESRRLHSINRHWASGVRGNNASMTETPLTLAREQQRLLWRWYLQQMAVVDMYLLNPISFSVNGMLNFDGQRSAITTWEMARFFMEETLASSDHAVRAQSSLTVLDKLVSLLGGSSVGELFSARFERRMYDAFATLPDALRPVMLAWAHDAWGHLVDELWSATNPRAKRPGRRVLIGAEVRDIREILGRYITAGRNLTHGYAQMYGDKTRALWSAMQEWTLPSLTEATLTLFIALLAEPAKFIQSGRQM